jgi:hypothetical protein
MLQDLKLKVFSAAIVASAGIGQPGAWGYGALVVITIAALRVLASAIQGRLPATWREGHRPELRPLRASIFAERSALNATPDT